MPPHETAQVSVYDTLVEPQQLYANLYDAHWVTIDCRFDLARPAAGLEAYRRGHIPNAHYADLERDLSSPSGPTTGRHPLPQPEQLARRLRAWGIDGNAQVVAYDDASGAFAARLWWLLRWLGHARVAVLNGGFRAWQKCGYPIEASESRQTLANAAVASDVSSSGFQTGSTPARWLTTEQVQEGLANDRILLIDAHSADRFAGQNETIDAVAGHVPGARNHPFASNLDSDQRFLPAEQLLQRWNATLAGTPPEDVVCMCGSGVTACHNLLALEVAGLKGAKLYAGSWSEWIRDPRRSITSSR